MKPQSCLATIILCLLAACPAAARKWTDNTGKFSVEAELEEVRQNEVVLKKTDGSLITVPLERLSTADRRYLASLSAPKEADKPPAPPAKAGRRPPARGDKLPPRRVGRQAIEQALGLPTTYAFVETPLAQALQQLTEQHQVELYVDVRALDDVGVPVDAPITAKGENEPLEKALGAVLASVKLVWLIRDDVLFITTKQEEASELETRVYALQQPVRDFDSVVEQLQEKVAPSSWAPVGGPGSIAPWPAGALVVAQTYSLHREIERQFGRMLRPIVHPGPKPTKPSGRGRSKPLEAMRQPAPCEFPGTPLADVAKFLAEQHKIAVVLDQKALEDIGIPPHVSITLKLGPVPLESALALLLRPLDLTWVIRDDELVITTPEEAERALVVVSYEVGDLLAASGGDVASLVRAIQSTISPASWDQVGGPGSLAPIPAAGSLQISQTLKVHRQIEQLLDDLRRIRRR